MIKIIKATLLIFLLQQFGPLLAQNSKAPKCGRLNEKFLYNRRDLTKPTETPFLGSIYLTRDDGSITSECTATLIDDRHLLTPATCIVYDNEPTPAHRIRIQLGTFKRTTDTSTYKCTSRGFCIPPPREYKVSEVKIHDLFDSITLAHNIAMIRLSQSVDMTPHIQPVCLKPKTKLKSVISRLFLMVGLSLEDDTKTKAPVITISRRHYDHQHSNLLFPYVGTQFSGTQKLDEVFYSGSLLLGMNIVNDRPQNFYIAGMLLRSARTGNDGIPIVNIFQDVQPYVKWIGDHIKEFRVAEVTNKTEEDFGARHGFANLLGNTTIKGSHISS